MKFEQNSEGFDRLNAEVLEGNFRNQTQESRDSITRDTTNLIGEFLKMLLMQYNEKTDISKVRVMQQCISFGFDDVY